jgi:hypothetical protein
MHELTVGAVVQPQLTAMTKKPVLRCHHRSDPFAFVMLPCSLAANIITTIKAAICPDTNTNTTHTMRAIAYTALPSSPFSSSPSPPSSTPAADIENPDIAATAAASYDSSSDTTAAVTAAVSRPTPAAQAGCSSAANAEGALLLQQQQI